MPANNSTPQPQPVSLISSRFKQLLTNTSHNDQMHYKRYQQTLKTPNTKLTHRNFRLREYDRKLWPVLMMMTIAHAISPGKNYNIIHTIWKPFANTCKTMLELLISYFGKNQHSI